MDKKRPRTADQQVPVGLEKVLVVASSDPEFRERLLEDRDEVVEAHGLPLRESERTILRSIPLERLEAAIERLDTSPPNLRRRRFMSAVAASAAAVVAAEAFGGCDMGAEDGSRPIDHGPSPDRSVDAGPPDGATKDGPTVDVTGLDTGLDATASKGSRPNG